MIYYVAYDQNGSVHYAFSCAEDLAHLIKTEPGWTAVGIPAEVFVQIERDYPHYFRFDGSRIVRKTLLDLQTDKYLFTANYPNPEPNPSPDPPTWEQARITWQADKPVKMWCNGPVGEHQGSMIVVASTPEDLFIQVDPSDPNYYTDRKTDNWSALGEGGAGGGVMLNARAPAAQQQGAQ